jgi:hypothetical protein
MPPRARGAGDQGTRVENREQEGTRYGGNASISEPLLAGGSSRSVEDGEDVLRTEGLFGGHGGLNGALGRILGESGDGFKDEARPTRFVWMLTGVAAISGVLFGYEYVFPTQGL